MQRSVTAPPPRFRLSDSVWTCVSAAGVSQPAAGGVRRPGRPHHASQALPDASHVHHGLARLLQTGRSVATTIFRIWNMCFREVSCKEHQLVLRPCIVISPSLSAGQLFGWIGERFKHQVVVFAVMALMAVQGVVNLQTQWAIIGEFSNLPQEELLDWIQENTRPGGWRGSCSEWSSLGTVANDCCLYGFIYRLLFCKS